jgi:transcriptional regulator with XRE-family HTH domain
MPRVRKDPPERLAIPDEEPEGALLVATNIGRLRTQRGWSESALAERIGIPPEELARALASPDMPPLELLWKIANALRVPVSILLRPLRRLD